MNLLFDRTAADLRKLNREALEDPESFLAHPVHAFSTVKRFLWDWVLIESAVRGDVPKTGESGYCKGTVWLMFISDKISDKIKVIISHHCYIVEKLYLLFCALKTTGYLSIRQLTRCQSDDRPVVKSDNRLVVNHTIDHLQIIWLTSFQSSDWPVVNQMAHLYASHHNEFCCVSYWHFMGVVPLDKWPVRVPPSLNNLK